MIRRVAFVLLLAVTLSGCKSLQPPPPPPAPATISVAALYERPAERALITGLSLYEQALFERAEQSFQVALKTGLRDRQDAATAHKYLAFISCAFNRIEECERSFRAAFAADGRFALSDAEIGHPIWGPVFKRVALERASK